MRDVLSFVMITIVSVVLISTGAFMITSSTQTGQQQRKFDCWNATYDSTKETCKVLSWQQKSFWADGSQAYSLPSILEITLQQSNLKIFSLLSPLTGANYSDWLVRNTSIDCYFPKTVYCGTSFQNIWLGKPFSPNKEADDDTRSSLVGLGCFLIVLGVLFFGIGLLFRKKFQ